MSFPAVRGFFALLFPGGLIFAATLIAAGQPRPAAWLAATGGTYLYTVLGVALLLGWRFDRSRLVFAAAVIGLAGWLLDHVGARPDATGRIVADAVGVLLPLNIALVAILKERGIFTWHGLLRWSVILVQPLVVWLLLRYQRYDWLGIFDTRIVGSAYLGGLGIEQPALLAFVAALAATAYRGATRNNAMETGLFWALALTAFALLSDPSPATVAALFGTAILILVVSLLELSHFMAFRDELTGLPGRRTLNQDLLKLGNRYSIAMLDVDHFKKFNDRYGHDVGDQVLKMVAAKMLGVTGGGKPYRYGGEEFTVLFPGRPADQALPHVERLRGGIADAKFTVRSPNRPRQKGQEAVEGGTERVTITVSIGVAERGGDLREPQEVIKAADQALYRAKQAGRNRVAT